MQQEMRESQAVIETYAEKTKDWFLEQEKSEQYRHVTQLVTALSQEKAGTLYEGGRRLLLSWMADLDLSQSPVTDVMVGLQRQSFLVQEKLENMSQEQWQQYSFSQKQDFANQIAEFAQDNFSLELAPQAFIADRSFREKLPDAILIDPDYHKDILETPAACAKFVTEQSVLRHFAQDNVAFENQEMKNFRHMMHCLQRHKAGQFIRNDSGLSASMLDLRTRVHTGISNFLSVTLTTQDYSRANETFHTTMATDIRAAAHARGFDPVKWKRGVYLSSKVASGGVHALSGLATDDFKKVDPYLLKHIVKQIGADPATDPADYEHLLERTIPALADALHTQPTDRAVAMQAMAKLRTQSGFRTAEKYWDKLSSQEMEDVANDIMKQFCQFYRIPTYKVDFKELYREKDQRLCASSINPYDRTVTLSSLPHLMPTSAHDLFEALHNTLPNMLALNYSNIPNSIDPVHPLYWHVEFASFSTGEKALPIRQATTTFHALTTQIKQALPDVIEDKMPAKLKELRTFLGVNRNDLSHGVENYEVEDQFVKRKLRLHAAQWLNKLDKEEFETLSEGQKRSALTFLRADGAGDQQEEAYLDSAKTRLFWATNLLESGFSSQLIKDNQKVLSYLKNDARVAAFKEHWGQMGEEDRLGALHELNANLCTLRDISPRPLSLFDEAPTEASGSGVRAGYCRGTEICLNKNRFAGWDDPVIVFATLAHEQLHAWQYDLREMYVEGKMDKDHPHYKQAMRYELYWNAECMLPNVSYEQYRYHPLEVPAWDLSNQTATVVAGHKVDYLARWNQLSSDLVKKEQQQKVQQTAQAAQVLKRGWK